MPAERRAACLMEEQMRVSTAVWLSAGIGRNVWRRAIGEASARQAVA
jgi:hypothetical protein